MAKKLKLPSKGPLTVTVIRGTADGLIPLCEAIAEAFPGIEVTGQLVVHTHRKRKRAAKATKKKAKTVKRAKRAKRAKTKTRQPVKDCELAAPNGRLTRRPARRLSNGVYVRDAGL